MTDSETRTTSSEADIDAGWDLVEAPPPSSLDARSGALNAQDLDSQGLTDIDEGWDVPPSGGSQGRRKPPKRGPRNAENRVTRAAKKAAAKAAKRAAAEARNRAINAPKPRKKVSRAESADRPTVSSRAVVKPPRTVAAPPRAPATGATRGSPTRPSAVLRKPTVKTVADGAHEEMLHAADAAASITRAPIRTTDRKRALILGAAVIAAAILLWFLRR